MADFQLFRSFFSRMGLQKLITTMGIVDFFRAVKFHELSTSAKFAEFTYLEKNQLYGIVSASYLSAPWYWYLFRADGIIETLFWMVHS